MEYLKRKIKTEKEESQETMSVSLINGIRLSIRWADREHPEKDVVINFTKEETKKLKKIMK